MSRQPVHLYRCVVNIAQTTRTFYLNSPQPLPDDVVRSRSVEKAVSNATSSGLNVTAADVVSVNFEYRGVM